MDISNGIYSPLREVLYNPHGYWAKSNSRTKKQQKLVRKSLASICQ